MAPRKAKTPPTPEESAIEAGAQPAAEEAPVVEEFTFFTPDADNAVVDQTLLRRTFKHQRNNKDYMVVGFCFIAAEDRWGVLLMERHKPHPVPIARKQSDVFGNFEDGTPRYVEVTETKS